MPMRFVTFANRTPCALACDPFAVDLASLPDLISPRATAVAGSSKLITDTAAINALGLILCTPFEFLVELLGRDGQSSGSPIARRLFCCIPVFRSDESDMRHSFTLPRISTAR
jgi:hypothetical protein